MHNPSTRRTFLGSLGVFAASLPALGSDERRTPNIVMMVGDDMHWGDLGFFLKRRR